ncbi:alpha/beta fold hydrolase [Mycobacterium colombiense]|uniref:alpha/beta fold hydrolase n=1 Tax=Mycobacterium colombiense TaxID=339268 RepID=UPI00200A5A0A|nr:alpha/beta hydrolase [Mycobacterium colombiense]MCK8646058.1 alpha/beta hydrolase [Mycobacterium colombiense]
MADKVVDQVATRDGRRLAYLEVGDPQGPLVIHNHGGPSSRLEARLFADAASKNRLRLVCVDRPGMGRSSPQRARSYSGWADDLTTIADALGHREFGVTGWSEGGPWALAAAAYIDPLRLRHVSSIAGGSYGAFGDNWAAGHLSKIDALGGSLALRLKPAFSMMYATLGITAKHFRGSFVKQIRNAVNEYDRRILLRPEIETAFSESCAECFAHGSGGLVHDAELLYRSWAFDVSTIARRVHMWQGLDDRLVPDPINKAVAEAMPGAVWHPVAGAGHFVAVGSGDEIFAIAAEELGGRRTR